MSKMRLDQISSKYFSHLKTFFGIHAIHYALIVLLICIGYYRFFLGYNFLTHEDWVSISDHTYGLKFSNGWRPDKGLGMSSFFADPGMWHPWAPLTLWEKLWSSREISYSTSVIVIDILIAWSLFIFLRRIIPKANPWIMASLVPLVIFGENQSAYHYARALNTPVAALPLAILVLYDFYQRPRWIEVYKMILLFCFTAFLGSTMNINQLISVGAAFTILYKLYLNVPWKSLLMKVFFIYGVSSIAFLFLDSWGMYSIFIEQKLVGYAREKIFEIGSISLWPNFKGLLLFIQGVLPLEPFSIDHDLAVYSYAGCKLCIQVVFPLIFLNFIFCKSNNIWEFLLKWLNGLFFLDYFMALINIPPGYHQISSYIANTTFRLFTRYDFTNGLQVALIVLFVTQMTRKTMIIENHWGRIIQKAFAGILCVSYLTFLIFNALLFVFPDDLNRFILGMMEHFWPLTIQGVPKDLFLMLAQYNLVRLRELISPQAFIFFATSTLITGLFLRDRWLKAWAQWPRWVTVLLFVVNAFALSWTVYPLNKRPMAWKQLDPAVRFEPTDRFYFSQDLRWNKDPEGFRKRWLLADGTLRHSQIGLLKPPGLNLSGFRSFATQDEQDYIKEAMAQNDMDINKYKRLYYGQPPIFSSLFDMAAVKYYYSDRPIHGLPSYVVPYAQGSELFVYKNTKAWPYYYLAQKFEEINSAEEIRFPEQGTAYLKKKDLPSYIGGKGRIYLKRFSFGSLSFNFESPDQEFLVVADAWHPFWKAQTSYGHELKIIKTNKIFKGVLLPAGRYQIDLFFDTRPYYPGLYVSLFAWMVFCVLGLMAWRNRNKRISVFAFHRNGQEFNRYENP